MLTAVYYGSVLLCVVALFLCVKKIKSMFRKEFPDAVLVRTDPADWCLTMLKFVLIIICPVVNTIMAIAMIYNEEDLCESTMVSLRKKYSEM